MSLCALMQGKILIDIGAYIGEFTDLFLNCVQDGKAILFEPQRESYELLVSKYQGNKSIVIYNCAVGSVSGDSIFYKNSEGFKSSLLPQSKYFNDAIEHETVKVAAIDEMGFVEGEYFMKIDAQGADLRVLGGSRKFIQVNKPIVMCELIFAESYIEQNLVHEIIAFLYSLGYQLVKMDNLVETDGILAYCDAVFIHKGKLAYTTDYLKVFQHYETPSQRKQIEKLHNICDERLQLIDFLHAENQKRLEVINMLQLELNRIRGING